MSLFAWLERNDLTQHSNSYQEIVSAGAVAPDFALGLPAQRARKKTRDEIKHITDPHQALASPQLQHFPEGDSPPGSRLLIPASCW